MAPDNYPHPSPKETPATELSAEKELPRFLLAVKRYEQFLETKAKELGSLDANTRAGRIHELMTACGGISRTAQEYDFAINSPSLAGTSAETIAAQSLAAKLAEPGVPPEVKAMYEELYGDDLRKHLSTE